MIMAQAVRIGAVGVPAGVLLAWVLGRLVQRLNLLVDVQAGDTLTFAAAILLLAFVLLAATYVPARRAAATDPASALRAQ